jgi:ethanolaminephosphotransferase
LHIHEQLKELTFLQKSANQMYVTKEALDNLKYYKYGSVDLSPLSYYILQPYWSWCVQFFPLWMAPNLITLIGLGFVVANAFLAAYLVPDLESQTYTWVYYSFAAGIWLYSTFDNVDGKQARRTGSSSPLGELFDHGCDALNCSVS